MSVDWEAEGLLDGLDSEEAREARRALLEDLHGDGCDIEDLRRAVEEDRLALLPVERILEPGGERFSAQDIAERTGASVEFLGRLRTALGLPRPADDEPVYTEDDLHAVERQLQLEEAGYPEAERLEVARTLGQAMGQVAGVVRDVNARTLARPGDTERERGLRYAEAARASVPLLGPLLEQVLTLHLRQQLTQEVVSAADLAEQVAGSRPIGVAFADLVGFTRLGEEIPPEDLGAVAGRLTELAGDVVRPPVRVVKFIGDAAMLVSPREPEAALAAALDLVEAGAREGEEFPQLRAGAAAGEAIGRGGDWYGRPVNVASRLTQMARPSSVLVTEGMKEAAGEDTYRYSFAGRRKLRGVRGELPVFRVRRSEGDGDG